MNAPLTLREALEYVLKASLDGVSRQIWAAKAEAALREGETPVSAPRTCARYFGSDATDGSSRNTTTHTRIADKIDYKRFK